MGVRLLGDLYSLKDDRVGDSEDEEKPTLSYIEIFYHCLPQYLAMGMSADEFWNCDPRMYRVYREKKKIELQEENERLWLQGMYVYQSMLLVAPSFNDVKPREPQEYPSKPFDLGLETEDEKTEERELSKNEIQATPQFIKVVEWMYTVNRQKQGETNG